MIDNTSDSSDNSETRHDVLHQFYNDLSPNELGLVASKTVAKALRFESTHERTSTSDDSGKEKHVDEGGKLLSFEMFSEMIGHATSTEELKALHQQYLMEITRGESRTPPTMERNLFLSALANGTLAHHRDDLIITFQRILAGGLAGMLAKTVVAPVDRIKILFQVTNEKFRFRKVAMMGRKIVALEGIGGLWRGNSATMIRVFPYAGTQFMIFDTLKRFILSRRDLTHTHSSRLTNIESLISGSVAGAVSAAVTYPLDLARARMAVQSHDRRCKRPGVFKSLKGLIESDGILAMYRGVTPSLAGIVPYAGIAFSINEHLKHEVRVMTGLEPTTVHKLAIGAFAGLIAQSFTYPFEMVRRRMQTDGMLDHREGVSQVFESNTIRKIQIERPGIFQTAKVVVKEQGFRGLYKGLSMNWIKGPVGISISFTTFDFFKRHLGIK